MDNLANFNSAKTTKERLEVLDKIFDSDIQKLCNLILIVVNSASYKRLMIDVREYYGDYEIIRKIKNIVVEKIKNESLHSFSNFEAYFKRVCFNVMRDMAKSKDFKLHQGNIYYFDVLYDIEKSMLLPLSDDVSPEDCLKSLYNSFQYMHRALDAGKLSDAYYILEAYRQRLKRCKGSETEILFLQAMMLYFRAHLHMHKGRFELAKKYLFKGLDCLKEMGDKCEPHFVFAQKNLLALTLITTKKIKEGIELLSSITSNFQDVAGDIYLVSAKLSSILLASKFTAMENLNDARKIITNIPRHIEYSSKIESSIYNTEVYINIYSDGGNIDEALKTLEQWDDAIKTTSSMEKASFERFLWYANASQAWLYDFKTRDESNLKQASDCISKAKNYYAELAQGKLWEPYFAILEGYITKNKRMAINGIWNLKRSSPLLSDWYREKLKDVVFY